MREAFLTGGGEHFDATDAPASDAATAPLAPSQMWAFSSVALTDEFNLTLAGCRMGSDASDDFTITRYCKPHPDMLKALRRLTLHMCLLREELKPELLYPQPGHMDPEAAYRMATRALREGMETGAAYIHPDIEKFRCTSVLWKAKGIMLKGVKKARYRFMGTELKVEAGPVEVRLGLRDDDEEPADWEYPFFEQLDDAQRDLTAELVAFMDGKYGEGGQQLELFGRDPDPVSATTRNLVGAVEEFLDKIDAAAKAGGYTVSVGTSGGEMKEVTGKKRPARRVGEKKGGQAS